MYYNMGLFNLQQVDNFFLFVNNSENLIFRFMLIITMLKVELIL